MKLVMSAPGRERPRARRNAGTGPRRNARLTEFDSRVILQSMDPRTTKERLLDAAALVFIRHGYAAASMDMVRQEAGVSNGSLYHHYPTKNLLADALYAATLRTFHATLLRAVGSRASAQSGVKGLVRAYVQWVADHPERARWE